MQYGKIVDGVISIFDGKPIRVNGVVYVNPTPDILLDLGYKPIVEDECPEERDGYYIVPIYTEEGDHIRKSWEYREIDDEL